MWIKLEGYKRDYRLNDLGDVKVVYANGKEKILKNYLTNTGYKMVDLAGVNGRERWLVHRLVATHFIKNPDDLPTVDHIDRDKTNNIVSNLRWASYLTQNKNKAYKFCQFKLLDTKGNVLEFKSQGECRDETGLSIHQIYKLINGDNKSAKGYVLFSEEG